VRRAAARHPRARQLLPASNQPRTRAPCSSPSSSACPATGRRVPLAVRTWSATGSSSRGPVRGLRKQIPMTSRCSSTSPRQYARVGRSREALVLLDGVLSRWRRPAFHLSAADLLAVGVRTTLQAASARRPLRRSPPRLSASWTDRPAGDRKAPRLTSRGGGGGCSSPRPTWPGPAPCGLQRRRGGSPEFDEAIKRIPSR